VRIHQLHRETWLPVETATAFAFFCDPANLQRITPPELDFVIDTPPDGPIREGVEIGYRLRLWGVPFRWRSRIIDWRPDHAFADVALVSPYRLWHHRHVLVSDAGGTRMTDHVDYALPFAPIGELAHPIVRRQLDRIFDHRQHTIREIFGGPLRIDPRPPRGGPVTA